MFPYEWELALRPRMLLGHKCPLCHTERMSSVWLTQVNDFNRTDTESQFLVLEVRTSGRCDSLHL